MIWLPNKRLIVPSRQIASPKRQRGFLAINALAGGGVGDQGGDPYFSYNSLLCHCEGADEGTTFTDVMGHTLTVSNAKTDSAQFKFGSTAAAPVSLSTAYVGASGTDFAFGTGDFTVEGWVRYSTVAGAHVFNCASSIGGAAGAAGWFLRWWPASSNWVWYSTNMGGSAPSANTWYHLSVTRASGTLRFFIDGALVYSGANSTNYTENGFSFLGGNSTYVSGHMDEVRVTKGIARYTAAFTVPSAAFPDY